jgi:hypothetical protein
MQTSYFSNLRKFPCVTDLVSIAAKSPFEYIGREYKKLAPSWSIFKEYIETGDSGLYTHRFNNEILANLDPRTVFEELGDSAILLCYEKPGKFCHRRLVAAWLHNNLGIIVEEF